MLMWTNISVEDAMKGLVLSCPRIASLSAPQLMILPTDEFLRLAGVGDLEELRFHERWELIDGNCVKEVNSARSLGDLAGVIAKHSRKVLIGSDIDNSIRDLAIYAVGSNGHSVMSTEISRLEPQKALFLLDVLWRSTDFTQINLIIHYRATWPSVLCSLLAVVGVVAAILALFFIPGLLGAVIMVGLELFSLILVCGFSPRRVISRVEVSGCRSLGDIVHLLERMRPSPGSF